MNKHYLLRHLTTFLKHQTKYFKSFWLMVVVAQAAFFLPQIGFVYWLAPLGTMMCYFFGLFICGFIFVVRYVSLYEVKKTANYGQHYSSGEKWWLMIVSIIFIFPILYTLAYLCIWNIFHLVNYFIAGHAELHLFIPFVRTNHDYMLIPKFDALEQLPIWLNFSLITGYALASQLWFQRFRTLKSILLFMLSCIILGFIYQQISYPDLTYWSYSHIYRNVKLTTVLFSILLYFVAPAVVWLGSYFILKKNTNLH